MSRQNTTFSGDVELDSSDLAGLLCYPRFSEQEYASRLKEIKSIGVDCFVLGDGGSTVNGHSICGKGCVGIVVRAKMGSDVIALKIRRTDADRASMENEAKLQKIANGAGAGPRYLCHTENLIAMEFVPGKSVIKWIESASAPQFRNVARNVLEQCFCLDQAGIDHGELSRLGRHVIVSEKDSPYIIDFESASTGRKTINVSSATQSLFLYGAVAAKAGKLLSVSEQDAVIEKIREYKHRRDRPAFERLVESLEI